MVLGGNSGERQVSLDSGRACIKALRKKKYIVSTFDPKFKNLNLIDKRKIDVIFNALHGKGGEDGLAQSYFEYLGVPYTHSGVVSSYNAMDKQISKIMFKRNKILTPKYFIINSNQFTTKILISLLKKNRIDFPVVIKPTNEGSSIGVKIIQNLKNLQRSIIQLRKNYSPLIIEKFIGGQEIQVAVINNKPIGAIELIPKRSFYDYKAKYTKAAKTEHIMPAKLGKKNYESVLKIAMRAHRVLNCKGVTRADFKFFDKRFYLLEINTQPGMTNLSLVPEIANYYGIEFPDLIEQILLDASINR